MWLTVEGTGFGIERLQGQTPVGAPTFHPLFFVSGGVGPAACPLGPHVDEQVALALGWRGYRVRPLLGHLPSTHFPLSTVGGPAGCPLGPHVDEGVAWATHPGNIL